MISLLSRDTVLSPTDRLPNRLALRSADTKPLAAATPPASRPSATSSAPLPGSNPAMDRTSSRAPEPSTPTNGHDLAGRHSEVDVLELAAAVRPAVQLDDRRREGVARLEVAGMDRAAFGDDHELPGDGLLGQRLTLERQGCLAVEDDHHPVRMLARARRAGG